MAELTGPFHTQGASHYHRFNDCPSFKQGLPITNRRDTEGDLPLCYTCAWGLMLMPGEIAEKLQIWETANLGQGALCRECGQAGFVGDDISAGYRVTTMAEYKTEGYFWFHAGCVPRPNFS